MATRRRILAVDDNDDALELIRISLTDDYDVVTLSDPVDLYEVLDVFEPDLLILDVMMPRINGFQLLEMLRKNPGTKELPIIVLSAKTTSGEIKHGYRLGATLYLTKPFQTDRLRKNVQTQFEYHPPTKESKSAEGRELAMQIKMTPSFKKGHLGLPDNLQNDRENRAVFDARKNLEEKIRRNQQERRTRLGGNGGSSPET